MELTVSQNSIIAMGLAMVAAVALPVAYAIYARKVLKVRDLFAGILCYMVFGMLLSNLWLGIAAGENSSVKNSPVLYATVTCVSLGIIEEMGRYLLMFLLRNKLDGRGVPLSFGIGYAAIPLLFIGGSNMYVNISSATALNNNGLETVLTSVEEELQEQLTETLTSLAETPYTEFLIYALGLAAIFVTAVSMSVIIWYAVSDESRGIKYGLMAVGMHMVILIPEELYYCGAISNGFVGEAGTLALSIASAVLAFRLYRKLNGPYSPEADHVNRFNYFNR